MPAAGAGENPMNARSWNDEVAEDLREALVVEPRHVYVAESRRRDPHTLEAVWMLAGKERTVHWVGFEELAARRREAGGEPGADHARAVREARSLFAQAAALRATDLHLRLDGERTDVLVRLHGELRALLQTTRYEGERLLRAIYGTMSDVAEPAYSPLEPQDARVARSEHLPPGVHSLRIATGPTVGGAQMVVRFLYVDALDVPADADASAVIGRLGYGGTSAELLLEALERPGGLLVVAGPTGSGKSTTLKYLLEALHRHRPGLNIQSLEDPPEYPIRGVVQVPVLGERGSDRRAAIRAYLRHALRVDPDVLMIGEIRDRETAALAVEASLTGHQVWSTIHANDADTVTARLAEKLAGTGWSRNTRILEDPSVLHTVVYQRLLPRLCSRCRHVRPLSEAVMLPALTRRRLADAGFEPDRPVAMRRPEGCDACHGVGLEGLLVVADVRRGGEDHRGAAALALRAQARALVAAGRVDALDAERAVGPLHPAHGGGCVP
jgi:general secretion pathway protein E